MTLIDQLQISNVQLTKNGFTAQMQLSFFHAQPQGYLNGGATLAFAEIASGMASNLLIEKGFFAVGKAIHANHLAPTKASGILKAQAILLHKSPHNHLWELSILNDQNKLISKITVENAIIKN
ncbi:hotdog fold thioesterase [Lactococcus hircilactis]|uniref:Hotdog fold thioesterase n=1 Tax=Lactococcus hircilactis TaxID=1494462 RepID=A0A7X1Z6Y8_9LACT|nr:PaaI family thioesterase [Lactococcus hircilactis]MQW38727.1 hotdog fold thioesterase [Lactococcus hircilactis]